MEAHAHTHAHEDIDLNPASWTDGKRYAWLLGLLVPLIPVGAWLLVEATGLGVFWFFGPMFVYIIIPTLDWLIGKDNQNPPDSVLKWLEQDKYYRYCTYAYLPLQYISLALACYFWSSGDLSLIDKIGLAFSIGMVGGIGINTAHELGHKRDKLEKWLSKVALAQTGYGHFFIEHNRGHHVRVATPEDPASSRMGESFWRFLPRTVSGSFTSAWELERERLGRGGQSPWTYKNDILNAWAMTIVVFGVLVAIFGVGVLPFLVLQAVYGFSLLEVVNYLEHYGLRRQWSEEDGRYERTRPEHSWNSDNVSSNVFLYHLQRHSDHHAHPLRRYQALRSFDDAPEMPSGYATMIVFASIPPVWKRIMDHRVVEHYRGDLSLVNIQPGKEKKIHKRWGNWKGGGDAAVAA